MSWVVCNRCGKRVQTEKSNRTPDRPIMKSHRNHSPMTCSGAFTTDYSKSKPPPTPPHPVYYRVSLEVLSSLPPDELTQEIEEAITSANQNGFHLTTEPIELTPKGGKS